MHKINKKRHTSHVLPVYINTVRVIRFNNYRDIYPLFQNEINYHSANTTRDSTK